MVSRMGFTQKQRSTRTTTLAKMNILFFNGHLLFWNVTSKRNLILFKNVRFLPPSPLDRGHPAPMYTFCYRFPIRYVKTQQQAQGSGLRDLVGMPAPGCFQNLV